jgi:hypothetical protein
MQLESIAIEFPYESQLDIEVPKHEIPPPSPFETVLRGSTGNPVGTLKQILEAAKSDRQIVREFQQRAPRNGDEAPITIGVRLAPGCHWLDESGQGHAIVALHLRGTGRLLKDAIPISRSRYGDTLVLSGTGEMNGSQVVASGVHPSDTQFSMALSLAPGTEPLVVEVEINEERGNE